MTDAAPARPLEGASEPAWRIFTGALSFAAGVYVCGAVGSWTPTDPSWNVATSAPVQNLFGESGAVFADLARQGLGWAAWLAGFALMMGGAMRAVLVGRPRLHRWCLGAGSIPLFAAALGGWAIPGSWQLSAGLGGVAGDALFALATLPFKAVMLPAPGLLASLSLLAGAVTLGGMALGLGRREAGAAAAAAGEALRDAWRFAGARLRRMRAEWRRRQAGDARIKPAAAASDYSTFFAAPSEGGEFGDADADSVPDLHPPARAGPGGAEAAADDAPKASAPAPKMKRSRRKAGAGKGSRLPALDLLQTPPPSGDGIAEAELLETAEALGKVLGEYGVRGRIKEVRPGPVITLFEFEPAPGVKTSRVISLGDDVARSMSAATARLAVVPGKNAIGIELPNADRETVYLRSLLEDGAYTKSKASLPMALGEDIGGAPMVVDLAKMPHLLIAGTTGSGKSVGVNAMILSLLYRLPPEECRLIMIDPKMLELSIYEGIPHLLAPVVTDPLKAVNALKWTVREMEQRYELMSKAGVRNLAGFNEKARKARDAGGSLERKVQTGFDKSGRAVEETEILPSEHIPNIVVVVDEMADLMMVAGKEIEGCIQRLAQMARAAGIHLITATQRPSVDVITGTIKANFPTRISYMVTTKVDSRTILNEQGAEQLLGMGDLLYQAPGKKSRRCHGPFVSDEEVGEVVAYLKTTGEPDYCLDVLEGPEDGEASAVMDAMLGTSTGDKEEDLYAQAVLIVVSDQRASTSYLQRRLKVGYNKAAGLIDRLEEEGVISAPNHSGKREVLRDSAPAG